ncbi:hypothetical protein U1Q18_006978 [Sarracenia purpurea var. burkii]
MELAKLRKQLIKLLDAGLIQPFKAPYSAPVLSRRSKMVLCGCVWTIGSWTRFDHNREKAQQCDSFIRDNLGFHSDPKVGKMEKEEANDSPMFRQQESKLHFAKLDDSPMFRQQDLLEIGLRGLFVALPSRKPDGSRTWGGSRGADVSANTRKGCPPCSRSRGTDKTSI